MTVDGVDGRTSAYNLAGRLYLRTPLTLLSPTWQSSAQSADGMKVYVLDNAPVLLLSDQGTMVRAMIKKPLISTSGLFDTTTGAPRS
jgi:intracellular multiplication protein IcmK